GHVNWRGSPVSTDTAQSAVGLPGSGASSSTSARPSGIQEGEPMALAVLNTVRGGPPSGETNFKERPVPSGAMCTYAIHRPSGDQAGSRSSPVSFVIRSVWLEPGCTT